MNIIIKNLNVEKILYDINLDIKSGNIVNLLGENGSGKSTLFRAIANLEEYEGTIENQDGLAIGLVFQNPDAQFVRNIVRDDLAFSLEKFELSIEAIDKAIEKIASDFDIFDLLDRYTLELSGGEKQKVAIIANLLIKPDILLLDEAFEMIDNSSSKKFLSSLKKYILEEDIICIHINHDYNLLDITDDVIYLNEGKVEFTGNVKEFFKRYTNLSEDVMYQKVRNILEIEDIPNMELEELLCKLN